MRGGRWEQDGSESETDRRARAHFIYTAAACLAADLQHPLPLNQMIKRLRSSLHEQAGPPAPIAFVAAPAIQSPPAWPMLTGASQADPRPPLYCAMWTPPI